MKYVKATSVLPESLISEIQKYVQGETIYIPKQSTSREKWGSKSGTRRFLKSRNATIKNAYSDGTALTELADKYCLSVETIKKIVYSKH
ncbi:CD3324 family protein [Heyndrickxia acidicola]|uniref:CD3324 family protein n=1 Tax=Heyndrickxia acidicola TaxID=209389 RepID=A0ABU6MM31_9BACI|nr:CD3324 family protein [Heyndrickxia acidicola]MED1205741.1 CD3324 family protein [Heyndrickxia acidicola]